MAGAGRMESLLRSSAAIAALSWLLTGPAGAADPAAAATAAAATADAGTAESAPAAAPAAADADSTRSLDADLQTLKKNVTELNRDLFVLEEELLFPANTQVAVFVSMD